MPEETHFNLCKRDKGGEQWIVDSEQSINCPLFTQHCPLFYRLVFASSGLRKSSKVQPAIRSSLAGGAAAAASASGTR